MGTKKRTILCIVGICILVLGGSLLYRQSVVERGSDPYQDTLICYLEAMKAGTADQAAKFASFPNEDIKSAYLSSPIVIVDYEIKTSEIINDQLRAYTLLIKDSMNPDVYRKIYYFVGTPEGQYTVYINAEYVPDTLSEELNKEKYSYKSENLLGVGETEASDYTNK